MIHGWNLQCCDEIGPLSNHLDVTLDVLAVLAKSLKLAKSVKLGCLGADLAVASFFWPSMT